MGPISGLVIITHFGELEPRFIDEPREADLSHLEEAAQHDMERNLAPGPEVQGASELIIVSVSTVCSIVVDRINPHLWAPAESRSRARFGRQANPGRPPAAHCEAPGLGTKCAGR